MALLFSALSDCSLPLRLAPSMTPTTSAHKGGWSACSLRGESQAEKSHLLQQLLLKLIAVSARQKFWETCPPYDEGNDVLESLTNILSTDEHVKVLYPPSA